MVTKPMNRRTCLKTGLALAGGVALPAGVLGLLGRSGLREAGELTGFDGKIMGTGYSVRIAHGTEHNAESSKLAALKHAVHSVLQRVDTHMSTWRAASELSSFNQSTNVHWQKLTPQTVAVIEFAQQISELTSGAFDITIGPMVDLWGFGAGARLSGGQPLNSKPKAIDIDLLREHVGFTLIELDKRANAVRKHKPQVQMDLSGIAKGYAVDQVAKVLDEHGIQSYLVEVGGELRSRGEKPNGELWKVAIEHPGNLQPGVFRVLNLNNQSVATSGNYRNYFISDEQRYSHSIDPRTGQSVQNKLASVSVIAESTMQADALSTAMMIMGPDKSLEFAMQHDVAAHMILNSGDSFREVVSPACLPMLV